MSWRQRHPVWSGIFVIIGAFFAITFLILGFGTRTGTPLQIVIGVLLLVWVWWLLDRPGFPGSRSTRTVGVPARAPATVSARIRATSPVVDAKWSDTQEIAQGLKRLNTLPSRSRLAIINFLELDEHPDFTLIGRNNAALVGTNRRVFLVPEGRRSENRMEARPYSAISNAQIVHERNGGRLIIVPRDGEELPSIPVAGEPAMSHAIDVLATLRERVREIRNNNSSHPVAVTNGEHLERSLSDVLAAVDEASTPPVHSAFSETAHVAIPTAQSAASLTLGDMLTMSPTEFEEFTGRALESLGYQNVSRVGGAGDLAADLTATDPQGRSAIVQCKRYTPGSRVGSPALQAFIGMRAVHHKADRGIFVTTADYTQQAIDLAKEHDVVLIDGDDLVKIAALVLTPSRSRLTPESSTVPRFCSNCGDRLLPGSRYCPGCGVANA